MTKSVLVCLIALLSAGCAGSPLADHSTTLRLLVMGSHTERPLAGVVVSIQGVPHSTKYTDVNGWASWTVDVGQAYATTVCGTDGPHDLVSDAQNAVGWLCSLPEHLCGRPEN